MKEPTYLGDGIYAQLDEDNELVLTTSTHEIGKADNVIYFDTASVEALLKYLGR